MGQPRDGSKGHIVAIDNFAARIKISISTLAHPCTLGWWPGHIVRARGDAFGTSNLATLIVSFFVTACSARNGLTPFPGQQHVGSLWGTRRGRCLRKPAPSTDGATNTITEGEPSRHAPSGPADPQRTHRGHVDGTLSSRQTEDQCATVDVIPNSRS